MTSFLKSSALRARRSRFGIPMSTDASTDASGATGFVPTSRRLLTIELSMPGSEIPICTRCNKPITETPIADFGGLFHSICWRLTLGERLEAQRVHSPTPPKRRGRKVP